MSKNSIAVFCLVGLGMLSGCCVDRVYRPSGCCDGGFAPTMSTCSSCGSCGNPYAFPTARESLGQLLGCGSGCGDVYWGEWISDPPDDCDPCDNCGNWIGPRGRTYASCGGGSCGGGGCGGSCGGGCTSSAWDQLLAGSAGLWGWRCGTGACCSDGSCGRHEVGGTYVSEGEVIYDGPVREGSPVEAVPSNKSGSSSNEGSIMRTPNKQTLPGPVPAKPRLNNEAPNGDFPNESMPPANEFENNLPSDRPSLSPGLNTQSRHSGHRHGAPQLLQPHGHSHMHHRATQATAISPNLKTNQAQRIAAANAARRAAAASR